MHIAYVTGLAATLLVSVASAMDFDKKKPTLAMDELAQKLHACIQAKALEPHFCRVFVKAHLKRACDLPDYGPERNECFDALETVLEQRVQELKNKNS
jgi:hypothetical protein